jgi:uncharacterized damage-inducible protein DinB
VSLSADIFPLTSLLTFPLFHHNGRGGCGILKAYYSGNGQERSKYNMDRTTLLETLKSERARWDALLAQVDEARMVQPGAAGAWSVKDIIAHVAWYEHETVGLLNQRALIGSELWYRSLEERNAAIFEANQDRSLSDVQEEAQRVFNELLAAVASLSEEELVDPSRFQHMPAEWTPWKAIASNTYEHYPQHIPDVQRMRIEGVETPVLTYVARAIIGITNQQPETSAESHDDDPRT